MLNNFKIALATFKDVPVILQLIKELATFENLQDQLRATEADLKEYLFGNKPFGEVLLGYIDAVPISYALFLHNFSTLLAKPGIYLVDLYVKQEFRKQGVGRCMLAYLAMLAKERRCARIDWMVLDWNKSAISLYDKIGAKPLQEWISYRLAGEGLNDLADEFDEQVKASLVTEAL